VPHAIEYLREPTQPGDAIFVARAEPLIYFATDTRNPTPYGGVIPGMPEEQQRVITKALETTRFVVEFVEGARGGLRLEALDRDLENRAHRIAAVRNHLFGNWRGRASMSQNEYERCAGRAGIQFSGSSPMGRVAFPS
jgi:hypothetical protein